MIQKEEDNDLDQRKEKKNLGKVILSALVGLFLISLIVIYWVFPTNSIDFNFNSNSNFSAASEEDMQFYPNMRFPSNIISYYMDESCSLQKRQDMGLAFQIVQESTALEFQSFEQNGAIKVYCEKKSDRQESDPGFFIAGEGGPTNVTVGKYFNVMRGGEIILIKDSTCERPNIAIHELLHVLGFNHSTNQNNIMYPVSRCKQTIGQDTLDKINELYSYPSLPDLEFEEASAKMKGRTLDLNITVKNEGLANSDNFEIVVYGDGKEIKRIESDGIKIGYSQKITLTNALITQLKINSMEFSIEANFEEINKDNNKVVLNTLS